jgi:hypothetical protein
LLTVSPPFFCDAPVLFGVHGGEAALLLSAIL